MANENGVITCKAAVVWQANEEPKIETIEVSPPERGEVRVRLHTASLCHTDKFLLAGADLGVIKQRFPMVPMHEGAGVVESIGEGVTSVKTGDSVLLCNMPQCGRCKLCLSTKTNACLEFDQDLGAGFVDKIQTTRFCCQGKVIHHCLGTSSLTEYTVCREEFVVKIDPAADKECACLLSCSVLTGYGAVRNNAKVEPGSICGIWGLGSVGLSAVLGCKHAGASRIIGINPSPGKFELARKFGATDYLNPNSESFSDDVLRLTNGEGIDFAIECTGKLSAMKQAIQSTNKFWGSTTIIGDCPTDEDFCVGNSMQFLAGRRLNGCWMGGGKPKDTIPGLVETYLAGKLPLDDFITHRIELDDINTGINLLKTGKCIKVVVRLGK